MGLFRILCDCVRHNGGDARNQELTDAVIAAVRDPDAISRIGLLVATHRHKDHVSGFKMKGQEEVEFREIWMPWTENRDDPKARGVFDRQVGAAATAKQTFASANPALAGVEDKAFEQMANLVGFAQSNEAAMDTL